MSSDNTPDEWEDFLERAADNVNNFAELQQKLEQAHDLIAGVQWQFIEYVSNQKTDAFAERHILPTLRKMHHAIDRMEEAIENRLE